MIRLTPEQELKFQELYRDKNKHLKACTFLITSEIGNVFSSHHVNSDWLDIVHSWLMDMWDNYGTDFFQFIGCDLSSEDFKELVDELFNDILATSMEVDCNVIEKAIDPYLYFCYQDYSDSEFAKALGKVSAPEKPKEDPIHLKLPF